MAQPEPEWLQKLRKGPEATDAGVSGQLPGLGGNAPESPEGRKLVHAAELNSIEETAGGGFRINEEQARRYAAAHVNTNGLSKEDASQRRSEAAGLVMTDLGNSRHTNDPDNWPQNATAAELRLVHGAEKAATVATARGGTRINIAEAEETAVTAYHIAHLTLAGLDPLEAQKFARYVREDLKNSPQTDDVKNWPNTATTGELRLVAAAEKAANSISGDDFDRKMALLGYAADHAREYGVGPKSSEEGLRPPDELRVMLIAEADWELKKANATPSAPPSPPKQRQTP